MRKFKLKQEFAVCKEDCTPEKECSIHLFVTEEGLSKGQIMNMFNTIACGYVGLIADECRIYDKEPDFWADTAHWENDVDDEGEWGNEI